MILTFRRLNIARWKLLRSIGYYALFSVGTAQRKGQSGTVLKCMEPFGEKAKFYYLMILSKKLQYSLASLRLTSSVYNRRLIDEDA